MTDCASCGAKKAKHKWNVEVCAMRGKRLKTKLCNSCDRTLNGLMLAFFNHPKRNKFMRNYP